MRRYHLTVRIGGFSAQGGSAYGRHPTNMWYVYLLQSIEHGKYYIGMTSDIEKRLHEHNQGKTKSIKAYIPYSIIGYSTFNGKQEARKYEIHLKKNYQAKKEFIMALLSRT